MGFEQRVEIYRRIEEQRNTHLIVYVTSLRPNAGGQMGPDAIPVFVEQLQHVPSHKDDVDILIVSYGGDPTVAWRMISLLRERFKKVNVLLPYSAFSAATLLALGADKIVMHPFSNLGPVDPQLVYQKPGTDQRYQFGAEDLRHFLEFVRKDVGISDQALLQKSFQKVCEDIGSIPIGTAKRSTNMSISIGEKLLSMHMKDINKAKSIAESLNSSFFHHGHAVGRDEAIKIGLPIEKPDKEMESLLWHVWQDISDEMNCGKAFKEIDIVMNNSQARQLLEPIPQVQIPQNLPPHLQQQAIQTVLSQIGIVQIPAIEHELFIATIESVACKKQFRSRLLIQAVRTIDLNIKVSRLPFSEGWI